MAIKAIVDKIEDVPEQYRDLYTERNGKFEVTGVEGFRTEADVTRLTTALTKERDEHKKTKGNWSVLGERKPEDVIAALDRIPELEAAATGKLDEVKINELVEKRIGAKTGPLDRQLKTLGTQLAEKDQLLSAYQTKERTRSIHDSVRDAVSKTQGFQSSAMEDALMLAERMFEVNEEGKVTTKEGCGVTPGIEATVWLTELQQKRAHWWGPSQGGGAGGNTGTGGDRSVNPWSADGWNLTEQGRIYNSNPARAEQMARSAGVPVYGSTGPAKRK